jgi:glutathione reductase (NADPH)
MWSAAAVGHAVDDAEEYCWDGVDVTGKKFNWGKMKEKRDAYVKRLNGIYYNNLARDGVYLLRGEALFASDNELVVRPVPEIEQLKAADNAGENSRVVYAEGDGIRLSIGPDADAAKVLIACGGAPTPMRIPGGEHALSSDDFFYLKEQPRKALVLGAGYIAVELAHIMHSMGTETTLAVRHARALREFDDLVSETLWTQLSEKTPGFVALNHSTASRIVKRDDGLFDVTFDTPAGETVLCGFDAVFAAIGRTAGAGLNLADTSIARDKRGCVQVDDMGQTSIDNVFAVGDILGKADLTPVAINAGRRLSDWLFGGLPRSPLSYESIPTVVFTYPPLASCGLTEKQARAKHGDDVKVYKSVFTPMYYSMLTHKGTCAMKLVVQGPEERVVGIHMLGLGCDEMMQGFSVCVKLQLKKSEMDSVVAIHPSSSEEMVLMR